MSIYDDQRHPAEREAARLRIIMEAFVAADPYMKLQDAIPAIFAAELKTRDMEEVQAREANTRKYFELPDDQPETIAKWIDLTPDVITEINDGRKIQAIKEVHLRAAPPGCSSTGLKEAKDGVDHWISTRRRPSSSGTYTPTPPRWAVSATATAMSEDIANWMNEIPQADIIDYMNASKKIQAIKEVRSRWPGGAGLREAKDGVEYWERKFR